MDGLQGVIRSADGMGGHVCGCHCLACGTGSRAGRIVPSDLAGCRMGVKRGLAHVRHPEYAGAYPFPERFNGFPGPVVFRVFFLKIWQYALNAVNCPGGQGFMAGFSHEPCK
jgi:hypothetical protein